MLRKSRYASRENLAILAVVSVLYFLMNRRYTGPAYLADEIGYLSNAAFLGGHPSDWANSYHGGYSLLLAPIFKLFTTASSVWTGVMLLNALMWGAAVVIAKVLLERLAPDTRPWQKWLALAVLVAYPAGVTITGYAFSQSAFALCFGCAAMALLWVDPRRPLSVIPHSIFVGYLYWIHPVGLAVAIASMLCVPLGGWGGRKWVVSAINVAAVAIVVLTYQKGLQPWMVEGMTPEGGAADLRYPGLGDLRALDLARVNTLLGLFFGQISYLVLGTLGFIALGAVAAVKSVRQGICSISEPSDRPAQFWRVAIPAFLLLSIPGIIAESAVSAALTSGVTRIDHWLYGRYVEPVILPLLAIGLTIRPRWSTAVACGLFLLLAGWWLGFGLNVSGTVNMVNVPALWPQLFLPESKVTTWLWLAAAIVPLLLKINRIAACALVIVVFGWCAWVQKEWHMQVLGGHSNPSMIPEFVQRNYPHANCVGFDQSSLARPGLSLSARERPGLYSFYLFMTPLRKMEASRWATRCDGPLLTFNPDLAKSLGAVRYVGRETQTSLYVLVRSQDPAPLFPSDPANAATEQYWASNEYASCLFGGCISMGGEQFARYSQVGAVTESGISTDGRQGYLFFGPYSALGAGTYVAELRGRFDWVDGATIDVASDHGRRKHYWAQLSSVAGRDHVRFLFTLKDAAESVEVRLAVTPGDRLFVRQYDIRPASKDEVASYRVAPSPTAGEHRIAFDSIALSTLPRQVGSSDANGLRTDGRAGFLVYGPYRAIPAGRYRLRAIGSTSDARDSWLDIASSQGTTQHARFAIPSSRSNEVLVDAEVVLKHKVDDLEIRAFVAENAEVTISGYSFDPVDRQ